jgi:hypothetical protein
MSSVRTLKKDVSLLHLCRKKKYLVVLFIRDSSSVFLLLASSVMMMAVGTYHRFIQIQTMVSSLSLFWQAQGQVVFRQGRK